MRKISLGIKLLLSPILLGLVILPACAADEEISAAVVESAVPKAEAVDPAIQAAILAKLGKARPDLSFTEVRATEVPELFEVEFNGGNVVYATASGDFFVVGEIYQVSDRGVQNLTEKRRSVERSESLAALDGKGFITFAPEGKATSEIYVFTDVDCGYCRKLHQEVPRLNELGVTVNYLAYPRAGLGSDNFDRMASAWCSADPKEAMNVLKRGGNIPHLACNDHPVKEQYLLGGQLGVTGTPAIMLADGTLIPGYRKADDLVEIIGNR